MWLNWFEVVLICYYFVFGLIVIIRLYVKLRDREAKIKELESEIIRFHVRVSDRETKLKELETKIKELDTQIKAKG